MIRVLAAAYRLARVGDATDNIDPVGHDEIMAFFAMLPMEAGFEGGDSEDEATPVLSEMWLDTHRFGFPWVAPAARAGDIRGLAREIAMWIRAASK